MKEETFIKVLNYYLRAGLVYGVGRSAYWLSNLDDKTYDYYKKEYISHKPTTQTMCYYTLINTTISQGFWPFFMLSDSSVYEKNKIGLRDLSPPFPFDSLHWRGDRK